MMTFAEKLTRRFSDWLVAGCAGAVPDRYAAAAARCARRIHFRLAEQDRRRTARETPLSAKPGSSVRSETSKSVFERNPPWSGVDPEPVSTPGMLTANERRYYEWIGQYYSGIGTVVEIGPWLGLSTRHIVNGLRRSGRWDPPMIVYEDFVWRSSWMSKWLPAGVSAPENYTSFEDLFWSYNDDLRPQITVSRCKVADYDGNEFLPPIAHDGRPIEMCFVDCGRLFSVNEAWYRTLQGAFVAGHTLVVLQDWQNHKTPEDVWWEQMKIFTDCHAGELELIHEVAGGGIATFLFRGPCRGGA